MDPALFFGLSGTGKTTLSADPERSLIGDDEHGWGPDGLFNFEGGCYAKTIRLSPMYEPDIFATTRRFGTILENVDLDAATRELDLDSERFTENTRGAYPLEFIGNADPSGMTVHPRNVVFLTADAFGILPPISRLTREQAQYHFISGYTAKLAGTEIGVTEPRATFSAGFGAPFLPRHPGEYASMLASAPRGARRAGVAGEHRLDRRAVRRRRADADRPHPHDGPRRIVRRAGRGARTRPIRSSASRCRSRVPGVPSTVLRPRSTWTDPAAYDEKARELAEMFAENFADYADGVSEAVRDRRTPGRGAARRSAEAHQARRGAHRLTPRRLAPRQRGRRSRAPRPVRPGWP